MATFGCILTKTTSYMCLVPRWDYSIKGNKNTLVQSDWLTEEASYNLVCDNSGYQLHTVPKLSHLRVATGKYCWHHFVAYSRECVEILLGSFEARGHQTLFSRPPRIG